MESWHVVGQKVICVDDCPAIDGETYEGDIWPTKGSIYTIRKVEIVQGFVCFLLQEIKNPPRYFYDFSPDDARDVEQSFGCSRFRPIRPTSIEQFRHLLSPTPDRVRKLEDA